METTKKFKEAKVKRQEGEVARMKVVQGPDYGSLWVIYHPHVSIGRGEENDIVITDLKASRTHANLSILSGNWSLIDAQSANGTLLNGKAVKESPIKNGDTFALGESIFEFFENRSGTQMLMAPPKRIAELGEERKALESHQKRLRALTTVGGLSSPKSAPMVGGNTGVGQRKVVFYAVLGVLLMILMMDDDPIAPTNTVKKKKSKLRALASFLPNDTSSEVRRTAGKFFKTGFREFRERNFLRAKIQFETALQIDQSHFLAKLYLEKSDQEIEREVSFHLDHGQKSQTAGRLVGAKGHYEAVLRLLYRDQTSPSFIQATDELKKVTKLIKEVQ